MSIFKSDKIDILYPTQRQRFNEWLAEDPDIGIDLSEDNDNLIKVWIKNRIDKQPPQQSMSNSVKKKLTELETKIDGILSLFSYKEQAEYFKYLMDHGIE